jgi:Rieske Fe-S protein
MNAQSTLTRRALITAGSATVVGAGALALAACSPSGANSSLSNGSGGTSSDTSKSASGTEVAKLTDIPVGGTAAAKIGGAPVLLAQPTAGTVVCFSAICTHQGCVVNAAAKEFDCPCHGSRFDAATGKVLHGPAIMALDKIAVTVSGDSVITA